MIIWSFLKKLGKTLVLSRRPIQIKKANIVQLAPNELLSGRCAIVTGGTSGIGLAIAKAFLQSGANVVITGRSLTRLEQARAELLELGTSGSIHIQVMDMSNISHIESCLSDIFNKVGKIDILVNNAGTDGGSFSHLNGDEYDCIMDTNLKGLVFLSISVGKYMKENSICGNILNIASSSSLRPANSVYMLSKWGVRGFTLGLAKSLIPHGIVVNGIAPGPTATPMMLKQDNSDISLSPSPIGRYTTPEEIAGMAVIMTSKMATSIVGDIVYMTGGAGVITFDDIGYSF